MDFIDEIKWTDDGLVPVIAQDASSGRVLMFAWMNHEALRRTVNTQIAVYWSRSRKKLWQKGESSGHVQKVKSLHLDCDGDVILMCVDSVEGIACHTGRESCFYRILEQDKWQENEPVIKSPQDIYGDLNNE